MSNFLFHSDLFLLRFKSVLFKLFWFVFRNRSPRFDLAKNNYPKAQFAQAYTILCTKCKLEIIFYNFGICILIIKRLVENTFKNSKFWFAFGLKWHVALAEWPTTPSCFGACSSTICNNSNNRLEKEKVFSSSR